jgi:hypothetical protein
MSTPVTRDVYVQIGDLSHDPKLAQALGDMIVAWSSAERVLIRTLMFVLQAPAGKATTLYFRIPTFEARTKIIRALLDEWEPPTPDYNPAEISHAVSKLAGLAVTRNGWIHSGWARALRAPRETVIFDHREKVDAPARRRPVKAADVRNHIEAVRNRTREIWRLLGFSE